VSPKPKAGEHSLDGDWRVPRAASLASEARAIRDAIDHLEDLTEMFVQEKDEETVDALRSLRGQLRSRASDRESEAEALEAAVQSRPEAGRAS
jgi:hypothetical protein